MVVNLLNGRMNEHGKESERGKQRGRREEGEGNKERGKEEKKEIRSKEQ